jgi:hypothetical protein
MRPHSGTIRATCSTLRLQAERTCPAERVSRGRDIPHARRLTLLLDMARLLSLFATPITIIHYTVVIITGQ